MKALMIVISTLACAFVLATLPSTAVAQSVTPQEVEAAIEKNLTRVPEFVFIRAEAEKLGVKVYLFGGTAAGYAHYVRNDLLRAKGDQKIQAARFDYDFTNIFRSTQDLDVVIDGSMDQIERLRHVLAEKYPHFIGAKAAKWELRSLRESKGKAGEPGYKEALLESPDFLNQNSDSNSTGLIEITGKDREVVLDLRDRTSTPSRFLKDVAAGEITFYESAKHNSTPRAQAGNNPEIFSVIRALTKAFQYDLTVRTEDWAKMRAIVSRFQGQEISRNADNQRRLIDMGKKLFLHAVDVERAWNDLERLSLRQKLLSFDSPKTEESMAWWLSKEPLRSHPVGRGNGRTAAQIARERGLEKLFVAHETRSFLALESIERSHRGSPNFFISRDGAKGEGAAHGDGTYTRIGREGAVGSGLTIRMVVDPNAREGTDFIMGGSDYVILRNKAAATVINEGFSLTPSQYIEMIANDKEFDQNEKGLIEKMTRRISNQAKNVDASEQAKIKQIYEQSPNKIRILSELSRLEFPLPISRSELERIIEGKSAEQWGLKKSFANLIHQGAIDPTTGARISALASEIISIATTYDQAVQALRRGVALSRSQESQASGYIGSLQRVKENSFDKLWKLAEAEGRIGELRELLVGSMASARYQLRLLPRLKTSAELYSLLIPLEGERLRSVVSNWISANPEEVMKLKPTHEELYKYFDQVQTSDRAEWAERALPYATTARAMTILFNARTMRSLAHSEAGLKMSKVVIANAKRFARANPDASDSELVFKKYALTPEALQAVVEALREVELERGASPTLAEKLKYSLRGGVPAPSCSGLFAH